MAGRIIIPKKTEEYTIRINIEDVILEWQYISKIQDCIANIIGDYECDLLYTIHKIVDENPIGSGFAISMTRRPKECTSSQFKNIVFDLVNALQKSFKLNGPVIITCKEVDLYIVPELSKDKETDE